MMIPREEVAGKPDYILPPLAQDTSQAAHSDRIVVLDGNGEGHPDYQTADRAIEFLRRYKDQPFFLGCGFVKPHSPPCAPQKFLDLYDADQIKLTPDFAPWPTVPPGFPVRPSASAMPTCSSGAAPAWRKPGRSSAPTSRRSRGPTGTWGG